MLLHLICKHYAVLRFFSTWRWWPRSLRRLTYPCTLKSWQVMQYQPFFHLPVLIKPVIVQITTSCCGGCSTIYLQFPVHWHCTKAKRRHGRRNTSFSESPSVYLCICFVLSTLPHTSVCIATPKRSTLYCTSNPVQHLQAFHGVKQNNAAAGCHRLYTTCSFVDI